MKNIRFFKTLILFLLCFATLLFGCSSNASEPDDLNKLRELLKPINVLGNTFELEEANGALNTDKINVYRTINVIPKKIIYVDEHNVKKGSNKLTVAEDYAKALKNDGEDSHIMATDKKDYVVVYSIRKEKGYPEKVLSISKFYDITPHRVLQNEYCMVIFKEQDNKEYIEQIVNKFMNTDMINIRHIIIQQKGNITDIRSY